jgi:predicted Zn-dependent peptidase
MFPGLNFAKLYDPIDEKAMQKLKFEDMRDFFSKWAVAPNVQIAVVGNFSVEKIAKVVVDEFADYSKGDGSLATSTVCPDWVNNPLEKTIVDEIKLPETSEKSIILVAYRMKKFIDLKNRDELRQNYGANSVLGHMLFYSRNSILATELKKNGIPGQLGGMYRTTRDFSVFSFFVVVPTEKIKESVEIVKNVVKEIPAMQVSKSDILASGKWTKAFFNRYLEGSDAQAGLMVSYLGYGLSQNFLSELLGIYESVTIEDVKKAAKENFKHYLMLIEKH